MNSIFRSFCNISSLIAMCVCMACLSDVYTYATLLPFFFFVFINIIRTAKNIWKERPLTCYTIIVMLWMRMVLLTFYGALSGSYSDHGVSVELNQHFIGAVSLSLYDCFAIALTLLVFSSMNYKTSRSYIKKGLYGQKEAYFVFVAIALVIYFTIGRNMHLFDFALKPVGEDIERAGDIVGGREMIVGQIVGSGLLFLFFLVIWWLKKQYDRTKSKKYFTWSLVIAILLIAIISGERRTSQVYKAFAAGYVLLSLYPSKGKKIVSYIGLFALFVLATMTIYKQFYGFMYSSYSEAVQNASVSEGFSYGMIDAYFYGLDTISKNIHYGDMMNVGLGQFFYDIVRNIFGLNFFVHGDGMLTTQIYNTIIYSDDEQLTGLLMSSAGYGYTFAGYMLAPLMTVFNIIVMLIFERCLRKSSSIEWQYVWAFAFMRFGFGVISAPPPLINSVSRLIIINAFIIGISRAFKTRA